MIKYIIYTILFTLTISPLVAQDIGADQTIPMDPDIRIGKLDNGLTYYIRHSENPKNRGEFYIVHNVGAMQEEDNQNGLAHFLEHMAFNGTKHFPNHVGIPCQYRRTIRNQRERLHVQKRNGIQYLRSSLSSGNDHRYRVADASRLVQLYHL